MLKRVTQKEVAEFYGLTPSAISHKKKSNPKQYKALVLGFLAERNAVSLKMFETLVELREMLKKRKAS